jgi:hypothetical protein
VVSTRNDGAVRLCEVKSACTTPGHSAADRTELFWSDVRSISAGHVALSWTSRDLLVNHRASGLAHPRAPRLGTQAEAFDKIVARRRRLAALGAIHLWRTTTSEQVAAVIGSPSMSSSRSIDLQLLLTAGLVQRGAAFVGECRASIPTLWRPDIAARAARFCDRLSYAEWLGIYACQEWSWGSQAAWHNLITTELSLRVAELTPIGTVFGELLASARLLFPFDERLAKSRRSADAVWVRDDGLRIVIETTANAAATFQGRLEHWISALLRDTERSTVVCFIDVSDPDNNRNRPDHLVRRAVADAVTAAPERVKARIAERMCFARYRDWFPGPGLVHPSFFGLRVERPTGGPGTRWEPADLLDPYAVVFTPADPVAARAPIIHAGDVYGVPHWLRGPGLDLEAVVRRLAGFPPPERTTPERRAELVARFAGRKRRADLGPGAQDGHGAPSPAPVATATARHPRPVARGPEDLGGKRGGQSPGQEG